MNTAAPQSDIEVRMSEFVGAVARSKVTVIVPLFGFWGDVPENQLDGDVLDVVLRRIHSSSHMVNILAVGDARRFTKSVQNALAIASGGGNMRGIQAEQGQTYGDYIRMGFKAALEEENNFIVVVNPWVLIQEGGIDTIVDRANRGDEAKIVCGYDFHKMLNPEAFDGFRPQTPSEERGLSFDFMCMPRYAAEMITIDPTISTHGYLERDLFQSMYSQGYEAIFSQRIPIFPFDLDWKYFEPDEQFEADRSIFVKKWGFDADFT